MKIINKSRGGIVIYNGDKEIILSAGERPKDVPLIDLAGV
jgi:hypothetical protein